MRCWKWKHMEPLAWPDIERSHILKQDCHPLFAKALGWPVCFTIWPQRRKKAKKPKKIYNTKQKKTPVLMKTRLSARSERHANTRVLSVRRPSLTSTLLANALDMDGDSCRDLDPSLSLSPSLQSWQCANAAIHHCWKWRHVFAIKNKIILGKIFIKERKESLGWCHLRLWVHSN